MYVCVLVYSPRDMASASFIGASFMILTFCCVVCVGDSNPATIMTRLIRHAIRDELIEMDTVQKAISIIQSKGKIVKN